MQHPSHSPFANYDITRRREFVIERTAEEEFLRQTPASYVGSLLLQCYRSGTWALDNIHYNYGQWAIYTINMGTGQYTL
jgi:hypothetical protein